MAYVKIIKDDRAAYDKMRKALFGPRTTVLVGITEEVGAEAHDGENPDVTTLMVAIWNEFGNKFVPKRSYLRAWFDENKETAQRWLEELVPRIVDGTYTKEQAFNILGMKIVGDIQRRITEHIPPPNAESTIRKKGSDTPLVANGFLRAKITHVIKTGRLDEG